jgi:hypothetical protein
LILELVLDLLVVLDDPVVNDRNAITGHVGVSIGLGDAAVRRPAGVRHAQKAAQRIGPELVFEFGHLADRLAEPDGLVAAENGDARRVIAAILEAPETLDQYWNDISFGDCADDSTHEVLLLVLLVSSFLSVASSP